MLSVHSHGALGALRQSVLRTVGRVSPDQSSSPRPWVRSLDTWKSWREGWRVVVKDMTELMGQILTADSNCDVTVS